MNATATSVRIEPIAAIRNTRPIASPYAARTCGGRGVVELRQVRGPDDGRRAGHAQQRAHPVAEHDPQHRHADRAAHRLRRNATSELAAPTSVTSTVF